MVNAVNNHGDEWKWIVMPAHTAMELHYRFGERLLIEG
jgi:hypothetical protein